MDLSSSITLQRVTLGTVTGIKSKSKNGSFTAEPVWRRFLCCSPVQTHLSVLLLVPPTTRGHDGYQVQQRCTQVGGSTFSVLSLELVSSRFRPPCENVTEVTCIERPRGTQATA